MYDDYAHHATEVEATLRAARTLAPERLVAVFQPHLYSRTLHTHRELGRALALADVVVVLDVYPARELPEGELAGVSGKLVADAAADSAHGRQVWWLPTLPEAERVAGRPRRARGSRADAGRRERRRPRRRPPGAAPGAGMTSGAELPPGLERDYPLARLTTIRTGGPRRLVRPPPERLRRSRACCGGRTSRRPT